MNSEQARPSSAAVDATVVFDDIAGMLRAVLGTYAEDLADTEITESTQLHKDLELESLDLMDLGGRLAARYGPRVDFTDFLADLDLSGIIYLTVGEVVAHVVSCLRETGT